MTTTGIWFIGARGNIATMTIVGAHAISDGDADTTGLVTEREPCTHLDLPDIDNFVFGGHDIRTGDVVSSARQLADSNATPKRQYVDDRVDALRAIDDRICTGTALNCGDAVTEIADTPTLEADHEVSEIVAQLRDDINDFQQQNDLEQVVVVNVASTEPPVSDSDEYATLDAIKHAIETDDRSLPASSLYAYAALVDGHPYVNFTPSTGSSLNGLRELALKNGVPHAGNDGKTGESLMKSALGPMFAGRNLRMLSWEGHNILGNTDGQVLKDEHNKAGKVESKGAILDNILDESFHSRVRIDYTPSLDDWKTAWDYVHFRGFLGTEMKLQFTWEGSDSALAAPLVLDLVRLLCHADQIGEMGEQTHLASFFKNPLGVDEHDLSAQFRLLEEYVADHLYEEDGLDGVDEGTPTDGEGGEPTEASQPTD